MLLRRHVDISHNYVMKLEKFGTINTKKAVTDDMHAISFTKTLLLYAFVPELNRVLIFKLH